MDTADWIEPLEQRYSHWAIPHIVQGLLGLMTLVFLLASFSPQFIKLLVLDPIAVTHGEVWRFFTFLFIPQRSGALGMILYLWFTWYISNELEQEWGAFKINLYFLISTFCLISVAFLPFIPQVGEWVPVPYVVGDTLLFSMPIVYGTVFPRAPLGLFPLPITFEARYLAIFFAVLTGVQFLLSPFDRLPILASFAGYFAFFLPSLWKNWQMQRDSKHRMKRFRGE